MQRFSALFALMAMADVALANGTTPRAPARAAEVPAATAPFSWTGFYIGGHGSLATGDTQGHVTDPDGLGFINTDYELSGALYGGHAGYWYQLKGSTLVVGVDASYSAAEINGHSTCVVVLNCRREVNALATATGRVGYTWDRALVYAFGGAAWGSVKTEAVDNVTNGVLFTASGDNERHMGWTAGAGLSYALGPAIVASIEYAHVDLGEETHTLRLYSGGVLFGDPIKTKVDAGFNMIGLRLAFKFGGAVGWPVTLPTN